MRLSNRLFILLLFLFFLSISVPALGESLMPDTDTLAEAVLLRVIDGDTVIFDANNILITVRLIGVNAPESGTPYSKNATEYLENALNVTSKAFQAKLFDAFLIAAYLYDDKPKSVFIYTDKK